jgi:HEAT repeat protein
MRRIGAARRWAEAVGLAVLVATTVAVEAAEAPRPLRPADPTLRVDRRQAVISARVENRPWTDVAAELARTSGVVVHLQPELEGTVTASFENVPAERAIKRLFGLDAQYVFRYDAADSSAVPTEVWVWRSQAPATPASRSAVPPVTDRVSRRAQIHAVVAQQAWRGTPILVEALGDTDPEVRKEAAVGLSLLHDAPVVDALEGLLRREQAPELRADVAEILATIATPPALVALRPALRDPEPAVRARVVAALINSGGEPGLALVHDAARGGSPEARRAVQVIEQAERAVEQMDTVR